MTNIVVWDILIATLLSLPMTLLFFWGLAYGIQKSLTVKNPAVFLFFSFVIRTLCLLMVAYALTKLIQPLAALIGFGFAFFVARFVSVAVGKKQISQQEQPEA